MAGMALAILGNATPSLAVEPSEMLSDPVLEARARDISAELRCVVCQNQSIDDSNAELARDLRVLVRDRLTNGDSNEKVIEYIVSRYGDFVLLRPPMNSSTYFLWFGPLLFALLGSIAVVMVFRQRTANTGTNGSKAGEVPHLSSEEQHRLEKLLNENATNKNGDTS
jgi:cytochrome c-type biogenesis protein CcmH